MSKIICPKCGAVNDEDAKFCIKCRELLIFEDLAHEKKIAERKETEGQAYCDKCGRTAYYKCDKCGKLFCNDHINRYKGLDYCEDCRKKIKNKEKIKVVSLVALVGIVIIGSSFVFGSIITHKASLEVLEFDIDPDSIDVSGDSLSFNILIKLKNNGLSTLGIEDIEFSDEILNAEKEIVLSGGEEKSISIPSGNISLEDVQEKLQKIEIKDIKSSTNFLLSKNTDVECIFSDEISPLETFKPTVTIEPEDTNSTVSKENSPFTRSIILENTSSYPVKVDIIHKSPDIVKVEDAVINDKHYSPDQEEAITLKKGENTLKLECNATKCGEGKFIISVNDFYSLAEIAKDEEILQSITSKSNVYFSNEDGDEVNKYYWPVDEIYVTVEDKDEKGSASVEAMLNGEGHSLSETDKEGTFRNSEGIPITGEMPRSLRVWYRDDPEDISENTARIFNAIDISNLIITLDEDQDLKKPTLMNEKEDKFSKEYNYTVDLNCSSENPYELSFLIIKKTDKVIQNVELFYSSANQEIFFGKDLDTQELEYKNHIMKKFRINDKIEHDNDIICIEIRYGGHTLIEINIKINIREEDKK